MAKLYELTAAYSELEKLADNAESNDEEIAKWLDECEGALKEKATDIAKFIKNLDATADAIADAESQMAARRKAIENRVKSIKQYLLRNMQSAGIQKIECPFFKIARQNNPASVVIDEEGRIPITYWRQPEPPPPSIDKNALKDDLKNGVVVDGAHLEQSERLVIK
jgi:hypothetical protein